MEKKASARLAIQQDQSIATMVVEPCSPTIACAMFAMINKNRFHRTIKRENT
jgi:hypothetical protein